MIFLLNTNIFKLDYVEKIKQYYYESNFTNEEIRNIL